MINFVMVNPKSIIESEYISNFVQRFSSQIGIVDSCTIFHQNSNEWEVKIETGNHNLYFCKFSIYTYNSIKQLSISIQPQRDNHFDEYLHDIKILLKETLKKDWEQILWLTDEQSSRFAEELYGRIYRVENELRNFINMVMVKKLGAAWWDKYAPEEVRNKHKARQFAYKRLAVSFQNVNDHLMAIDTDDLLNVMTNQLCKWEPVHDREIELLLDKNNLSQNELIRITDKLKSQLRVEIKVWETLFRPYLSDLFLVEWKNFSKNRNHIAHNKLIDKIAYEKIKGNIILIEKMIKDGSSKFSKIEISDEDREELDVLQEIYQDDVKDRPYEMAGVEVRNDQQILSLFEETINEFVSEINDEIYFYPEINIKINAKPRLEVDEVCELLRIGGSIDEAIVYLNAIITTISGDPGEDSILTLYLLLNDTEIAVYEVTNSNGDAIWNPEEGYYEPTAEDNYDTSQLDALRQNIISTIDSNFQNYIEELKMEQYSSVKDGGNDPIADFACEECGDFTVSLVEHIGGVGMCVRCGHQHDLNTCMKCDQIYNANNSGSYGFCDACHEYIQSQ